MIKIGLSGCLGKMGRIISDLIQQDEEIELAFGINGGPVEEEMSYPIFKSMDEINLSCDVIIDFSRPNQIDQLVNYCVCHHTPIVIATTGLSPNQEQLILESSATIPISKSSNTSLGMNVLIELVKKATSLLDDSFDIEIIEKHHRHKVDAPSGTAYMIADTISKQLDNRMIYQYGRHGNECKRQEREIGIHAIRGGNIPGEHTVIFAGLDEIIEIKHTALSKKIFANQAIKVAKWLVEKTPRLYDMGDFMNN